MEDYANHPESGKPEQSVSVETCASRQHRDRAPRRDVFSRRDVKWRREGTDDVLYCGRRRVLRLVPDASYSGMWRVAYPDSELGDLKNLTWARNEGARVALSFLNQQTAPGTPQRSSLTPAEALSLSVAAARGCARQSPSKKGHEASARHNRAGGSLNQDQNDG